MTHDRAYLLTQCGTLSQYPALVRTPEQSKGLAYVLDDRAIACVVALDRAGLLTERGICHEVITPLW